MTRTASSKAQARWRYYGRLGSLRMVETLLRVVAMTYPHDHDLMQASVTAQQAIDAVRAAFVKHEYDWKGMSQ